jgi:hypothetical protein
MPTDTTLSPELASEIAEELYIWGYPLVLMDLTRKVQTNFETATGVPGQAPMNQFSHAKTFPPPSFRDVVRPNFDTLYSIAWLDLGPEPMVLTLPKTERYHIFQLMDAWTEVFAAPGTRTTGGNGGSYLIAGPNWRGDSPKEADLLRSPTEIIWIVGRIQTNGASDYEFVHKLQDQLKLIPLSRWGREYLPAKGKIDPRVNMKIPPMVALEHMDGAAFFNILMEALKKNQPHPHDQGLLARMKRLGLKPGKSLDLNSLPEVVKHALRAAPQSASRAILKRSHSLGSVMNGWSILTGAIGYYGADYLLRAAIALAGLGANRPEDAVYPTTITDVEDRPLTGTNLYILHFPRGKTPPVGAFWSITMYDRSGFPVENGLHRQAIGDRDKLTFNKDGSLTIYIQHNSPGPDKESNWLPAPEGPFSLTMRCYSPKPQIASGDWMPPAIERRPAETAKRAA